MLAQPIQAAFPFVSARLDPAFGLGERRGLDGAGPHPTDLLRPHHAGVFEHAQVLHRRWQRHRQRRRQVADRRRSTAETRHHRPPRRIGKRLEHPIERTELIKHLLNYQDRSPGASAFLALDRHPPYERAMSPPDTQPAMAPFGERNVDPSAKPALVRDIFDRVAGRYDLMNDLMSGGLHRLWKDAAAARLNPQPGEMIVDLAGGTGDMAWRLDRLARRAAARRAAAPDPAEVVVVDYTPAMVAEGRARAGGDAIAWAVGDAQALPLADASADAVMIAFGLRNVTDISRALREMRRVLEVGGRLVCLEFSRPPAEAVRRAYDAFSARAIPAIGALVARDRDAYRYLVESIRRFPDQPALAGLMARAGFSRVSVTNFSGGICALHHAWTL